MLSVVNKVVKKKRRSVVTTSQLHKLSIQSASLVELGRIHEKVDSIQRNIRDIEEKLDSYGKKIREVHASIDLFVSSEKQTRESRIKKKKGFMDVDLKILDLLESEGQMGAKELSERCGFRDRSSFQKRYLRPMVKRKILSSIKRGRSVVYRMSEKR